VIKILRFRRQLLRTPPAGLQRSGANNQQNSMYNYGYQAK